MRTIRIHIEKPDPLAAYVFDVLSKTLGLAMATSGNKNDALDIYYGNLPPRECRFSLRIPRDERHVLWKDLLDGRFALGDAGDSLPFDLINGIAAFLTDRVNRDAEDLAFDEHDRLRYDASFQSKSGYGHVAIVNRYVAFLSGVIKAKLGVESRPLWPDGKRCAIVLTHDVDAPLMHGASEGPLYDARATLKRNVLTNAYRARFSIQKLFGATGLEHWHFPFIMDVESFRGFTSSFMFAATRRFDRNGHPDFDVSYDVNTAGFRDLFAQLNYRDFEIGLHAGYLAHENVAQLEAEKQKLEGLAAAPVRGVRYHVWHTGRDVAGALEIQEEAGFEYDSSLAFNRRAFLRRSVALPYRPWSDRLKRALDVIQMPVALMDGHIFYHPVTEPDAVRQAHHVVDSIREVGGIGAIDWHVRTSSPESKRFAVWGRTYVALLDYLAELDDVWVTNLREVNDWIRTREKLIG